MDWALVAERHVERVYRAARAEVADDHAAWDCVQEAFATALGGEAPDRGDPVEWLCGVARNHARHWKRGHSRWREAIERLAARRGRREPAAADAQALREALADLPIKLRDAVSLRYLAGMSAQEVARAQGISEPAAKMRVHRGLARLRARLGGGALVALLVSQAQAAGKVDVATVRVANVAPAMGVAMKKVALLALALALLLAGGLGYLALRGPDRAGDRSVGASLARGPGEPAPGGPGAGGEPIASATQLVYPAKRALAALRGVTVDEFDEPVAGVTTAVRADFGGIRPEFGIVDDRSVALDLRSAEDGSFGATVPVGPYRLTAKAADGREATAQWAVTEPPEAEPLRLVLKVPPVRDFAVTVVDRLDQPVTGAKVEVMAALPGVGITGTGDLPPLRGVTEAEGLCRFDVRPQSAMVFATTDDGRLGWAEGTGGIGSAETARVKIDVHGSIKGRLVGIDAELLKDATIVAHALGQRAGAVYNSAFGRSYETAVRDGAYTFERLAAGRYALTLASPSGARLVLPLFHWGREEVGNSVAPALADVVAGNTTLRDLEVKPGATLRGTVTTADGRPVTGALILAVLVPRNGNFMDAVVFHGAHVWRLDSTLEIFREHPEAHARTRTAPDGSYVLPGLQPGAHRVEVFAQGLSFDCRMEVELKDGETTDLRHALEPAGVLQGLTNAYLIGVVRKGEPGPRMLTHVSLDGLFTLPGLAAGHYEVRTFRVNEEGSRLLAEAEIRTGETTWTDLRSAGPVRLTCLVLDDQGPVEGVRARAWGEPWTRTGADGTFRWQAGYPWEGVVVDVQRAGLIWQYTLPGMQKGDTEWRGQIHLGTHGVEIRTQDASGRPAPAEIDLRRKGGAEQGGRLFAGRRRVPAAGSLVLAGLCEGEYEVAARFPDGTAARSGLTVPRTEPLVIAVSRTGTVAVTLADATGRRTANVQVAIVVWRGEGPAPDSMEAFWNGALEAKVGKTGPDGTVRIEGVPAGAALLGVYEPGGERQWPLRRGDEEFARYLRIEVAPEGTLALDLVTGNPMLRDR